MCNVMSNIDLHFFDDNLENPLALAIPNDVRCAPSLSSFKSRLKTFLFCSVYKDRTVSLITVHMCMVWPCHSFVEGLS